MNIIINFFIDISPIGKVLNFFTDDTTTDTMTTTEDMTTTVAMTTTDDMTTMVSNSTNNTGSSQGNYDYWDVYSTTIGQLYIGGHVYSCRKMEFSVICVSV